MRAALFFASVTASATECDPEAGGTPPCRRQALLLYPPPLYCTVLPHAIPPPQSLNPQSLIPNPRSPIPIFHPFFTSEQPFYLLSLPHDHPLPALPATAAPRRKSVPFSNQSFSPVTPHQPCHPPTSGKNMAALAALAAFPSPTSGTIPTLTPKTPCHRWQPWQPSPAPTLCFPPVPALPAGLRITSASGKVLRRSSIYNR